MEEALKLKSFGEIRLSIAQRSVIAHSSAPVLVDSVGGPRQTDPDPIGCSHLVTTYEAKLLHLHDFHVPQVYFVKKIALLYVLKKHFQLCFLPPSKEMYRLAYSELE